MKSVAYGRYGPPDVFELRVVAKPEPEGTELLIGVQATTVTAGDCRIRRADPFDARFFNGLFRVGRITVLGFELAGKVEEAGPHAGRFATGDEGLAYTGSGFGAYAEYMCLAEDGSGGREPLVAAKRAGVTFEEAAAVPTGGLPALDMLK